ncbi:hypothetical protein FOZ62_007712, partial [Perkinsus olseni]
VQEIGFKNGEILQRAALEAQGKNEAYEKWANEMASHGKDPSAWQRVPLPPPRKCIPNYDMCPIGWHRSVYMGECGFKCEADDPYEGGGPCFPVQDLSCMGYKQKEEKIRNGHVGLKTAFNVQGTPLTRSRQHRHRTTGHLSNRYFLERDGFLLFVIAPTIAAKVLMITSRCYCPFYVAAALLSTTVLGLTSLKDPNKKLEGWANNMIDPSKLEYRLGLVSERRSSSEEYLVVDPRGQIVRTRPYVRRVTASPGWNDEEGTSFYKKAGFDCEAADLGYMQCNYDIPDTHKEDTG